MGLSYVAAFSVISVSIIICIEVLTGNMLPAITDYYNSFDDMKDRAINLAQTDINITGVTETWNYRKLITIDNTKVADDLTNFPVLINVTDTDLRDKAQSDGDDIMFVLWSDNNTRLKHEIEKYDGSTGELFAWVNVTSVSSSVDTRFWMYYGNNACVSQEDVEGTWDSNYQMVLHLNETGTGTRYDTTGNEKHGDPKNYDGDEATDYGRVNGADDLDGTNDWINITTGTDLLDMSSSSQSFFAWIKTSTDGKNIMSKAAVDDYSGEGDVGFYISSDKLQFIIEGYMGSGATAITNYKWHYVGFTYDITTETKRIYVDGRVDNTTSQNIEDYNTKPLAIGALAYDTVVGPFYDNFFNGILDEVRVSNKERSSDWVNTSYNNMISPDTFFSFGNEESNDQAYLNITVKNTGNTALETLGFSIVANGTSYEFTISDHYLYPENEVYLSTTEPVDRNADRVEIISNNGVVDYYEFTI